MRKAAMAALGFTIAILLSHYLLQLRFLPIASAVSFCCAFISLLFRANTRRRIQIILISTSIGFIWSFLYATVFVNPYINMHEETFSLKAVVTDYPVERNPRGYRVDVSVNEPGISKKPAGARLYYYEETELKPGDEISVTARFYRTDVRDDGERYDTLTSRGIFLSGSVSGDIEVISSNAGIRYLPKQIARSISDKIGEIYPEDVSAFLKALLIGNRDDLYKDAALNSALSASGIIHIVAVSGMHISFLMGFLSLIIRNKRLFAFYAIPILFLFMAMTGFTPSVTRAGIMQIFLVCAPVFKRENDSITSLSSAMLLMLMLNPYACASVGLQMSFFATAGIIVFTSRINYAVSDFLRGKKILRKKAVRTAVNYITSSLATTIGALIFTLPLTVLHFGYFSLVSPLTNLLTIGVVSVTFPLGLTATLLGFIHPALGGIIAVPVTWAVRYIMAVARFFASIPFSVSYTSDMHILIWLLYVYIMFMILPMLKARLRQYLYPVCISVILLFAVILVSVLLPSVPDNYVTVIDVGQGLSVAAGIEGHTIVVDCGSLSTNKAGEITHEFLQSAGCTSIDILVITHFHDDHVNGVEYLMSRINVQTLVIPDPEGSYLADDIIELARKSGTDIIYVYETYSFAIGEAAVFIYPPLGHGDENEQGISVLIMSGISALITGDMNSSIERALLRYADMPQLDVLVAGHHGSRESTSQELLSALSPRTAVISVGRNSFGHPHGDTLDRLYQAGVAVYRTDETGNVTIVKN